MSTHTKWPSWLQKGQSIDSFVCNGHTCNHRSRAENYRAAQNLDLALSLPLWCHSFFFSLPFSLKGPNSQVAQIPHCTGVKGRKAGKGVREKSNLIQLKATIIWMSHSAVRFEVFFYVNSGEGENDRRRRGGGNHPVLEYCTSWGLPEVVGEEAGVMEKKKRKKERKQQRGMEGQWRTDIGLDRSQSSNFSSFQIYPSGHQVSLADRN